MVKWLTVVVIIILLPKSIYAQPGYDPFTLPGANEYVLKNWFDIDILGPQLPFDETAVKIFADSVELRNLNLIWHADPQHFESSAKHLVIIANSIKLGSGNTLDLESSWIPAILRQGCSIVLICRKFIVGSESNLKYIGASAGPLLFYANVEGSRNIKSYLGGYGSQLLIAAEKIEVDESVLQKIDTSLFNSAKQFLNQKIGESVENASFLPIKQDMSLLFQKYKDLLPSEEEEQYPALLNNSQVIDSEMVKKLMHLVNFQIKDLQDNQILTLLVNYDNDRTNFNSGLALPGKPFFAVHPFLKNNQLTTIKYNAIQGENLPIMIGTTPVMRPIQTVFIDNTPLHTPIQTPRLPFPCANEVFGAQTGSDALRTLSTDHQRLFSQWAVEWIKYKKTEALQAKALGNKDGYFSALRQIEEMPRYQLDDPYNQQYDSINTQMLNYLSDAKDLVSEQQLVLEAPLAGKITTVFTQGIPSSYYLPPSGIVLTGIRSNNNWDFGIFQQINSPEQILRFTLEGELKSDPLVKSVVDENLHAHFDSYLQPGLLPNIRYDIEGVEGEGIRKFGASVVGSLVNITLDIDPGSVAQVMLRFATAGLPYYLNWTVPGDPEQKGKLGPLMLRLNHRSGGRIHVNGLQIINDESSVSAKIRYVRTSTGRIVPIPEGIVKPGATLTLSDLNLQQGEYLTDVPEMGIEYDDGGFETTLNRFLIVPPDDVIDDIIITNKIPATISPAGTGLTYQIRNVEVDISLSDPNSQSAKPFSHLLLSPDGSDGSIRHVQLQRLSTMNNTYTITGKVNFSDGGSALLKSRDYNDPNISLTLNNVELPDK